MTITTIATGGVVRSGLTTKHTPGDVGIQVPGVVAWRHDQAVLLERVSDSIAAGRGDVIFWEGPPGSGKSLVPVAVSKLVLALSGLSPVMAPMEGARITPKVTVMTYTKALQSQYARDGASVIWGRANYPCINTDVLAAYGPATTCEDCPFERVGIVDCKHGAAAEAYRLQGHHYKGGETPCPYYQARADAGQADLLAMNYAYAMSVGMSPGQLRSNWLIGRYGPATLVVFDEAHRIEAAADGVFSEEIAERTRRRFGLPDFPVGAGPENERLAEAVAQWCPRAHARIDQIEAQERTFGDRSSGGKHDAGYLERERIRQRLEAIRTKIERINNLVVRHRDEVVVVVNQGGIQVKFLSPAALIRKTLVTPVLRAGSTLLIMSGDLGDPGRMAARLGIETEAERWEMACYTSDHMVPEADRPVLLVRDAPALSRRSDDGTLDRQRGLIADAIRAFQAASGRSVLVHTSSHAQARQVAAALVALGVERVAQHPEQLTTPEGIEWANALPAGTVIVSPCLREGWDAPPGQVPGLIVFAKTPFPDLSDPVVKARADSKAAAGWYNDQTSMGIVQGAGRGIRRPGDRCITVLADYSARRVLESSPPPVWFRKALREIASADLPRFIHDFVHQED